LAVAIVGCAPEPDAAWQPPGWPEVALRVVSEVPAPIDPASIPLVPQRVRNDGLGIQARFSYLPGSGPGVDSFNSRVSEFVRTAIAERSTATGAAYAPAVLPRGSGLGDRGCVSGSTAKPAAELLTDLSSGPAGGSGSAVVCDIEAAVGPVLGMRLRAVTGGPDGVISDSSLSLYVDTTTGGTATGDELWTDGAARSLTLQLVEMLREDARALSMRSAESTGDEQVEVVRQALSKAIPVAGGEFIATIPAGFDFAGLSQLGQNQTTQPMLVAIPPHVASPLLSPFGANVQSLAGQAYAGPARVPAGSEPVDCTLVPCVAVTYDDGPSVFTDGILDALAAHHSAATFFAMGENAAPFSRVLARIVAEGNEVQNHTWNHPRLPTLSSAKVSAQIRDTTRALSAATGQPVTVFRPPHGLYNDSVLRAAGLAAILWDVDTFDWQSPRDDVLVARAVDQPAPGSIVLMHDVQAVTARNTSAVCEGLIDRGFTLVTVSQLFGGALPTSGVWRHGPRP
jgi:peptidoglycan/xylan/chitin deacetylase (PgdA/CDA1 family)